MMRPCFLFKSDSIQNVRRNAGTSMYN
jgi:hypothetical protein